HPDRRHRRHRPVPAQRPRPTRPAGDDRWRARCIHDRDHRRNDPMSPAPLDLTPTLAYLRERITRRPRVLLVLGSGQGEAAADIQDPVRIPYAEIPGFAPATVQGHAGMLIAGTLEGVECLVMQG